MADRSMHLIAEKCILVSEKLNLRERAYRMRAIKETKVISMPTRVILHDLDSQYDAMMESRCDHVISADGKYAPCQGCFGCWTKHPAECFMKDKLKQACRIIGHADEVVIITKNLYGEYSAAVKNVLDRSIGTSTPFSTYRGRQMHHTLRYGRHDLWKVIVYGEINEEEKATFRYLAERNALNDGYARSEVLFIQDPAEVEALV